PRCQRVFGTRLERRKRVVERAGQRIDLIDKDKVRDLKVLKRFQQSGTLEARPVIGSQTTMARSTAANAASVSKANSTEPGQSKIDQRSPRKEQCPSLDSVLTTRLRMSPGRFRGDPAAAISASNRVDLPLP